MMSTGKEITSLGYWIRRRRKALDLTQERLAQEVGCAVATIKKIEADARRPSREMAERLADCLHIAPEERSAFLRVARAELAIHRLATPPTLADALPLPPVTTVPPVTTQRPQHNLPASVNRLIGRDAALAQVQALLRDETVRLVTLTGPGGIGKTRLALHVAHQWIADRPAECWFVNLAPVREATLVLPAIAQTLGVSTPPQQSVLVALQHYLQPRPALLLLDNFEQVIDAASALSELLAAAPGLKMLVTSRALLHLAGEYEVSVPPLALPTPRADEDLAALAACSSVQLLLERTQASGARLALTPATAHDLAQICRRLEGLPLAIELAAARSKLFTPHELLTRLDQRLQLLTDGRRDQPRRQQTLRLTLEWSYHLLQPPEQMLFARLSVFVGGFTLAAAEAVCRQPDEPPLDVIAGITALLDQSLLRPLAETTGERRFTMLETIRDYAREQLVARGEEARLCQQQALYFLSFAEQVQSRLYSAHQQVWFQRLIDEQRNFRVALQWWQANNDYLQVARLGAALSWFWWKHGELREEAHWCEWALVEIEHHLALRANDARAKALYGVALSAGWLGDSSRARNLFEEYLQIESQSSSFFDLYHVLGGLADRVMWEGDFQRATILEERRLALSRTHAFPNGIADSLKQLGYYALWQGKLERAERFFQESLTLRKEVGSITGLAAGQGMLGMVAREQGDFAQAELLLQQGLELFYTLDDKQGIGWLSSELGAVAQLQQAYEKAYHYQHSALLLERELGFQFVIAIALVRLGNLMLVQDDWEVACMYYVESLEICQRIHLRVSIASALEGLAGVAVRRGHATLAARWLGAAEAHRQTVGIARSLDERTIYEPTIAIVRTVLGDAGFAEAFTNGRSAGLNDIIAEALCQH